MSRIAGKYWLNKDGSQKKPDYEKIIAGLSIKFYKDAGVMQVAEWKNNPRDGYVGYGKAFTVHLDKLTDKDMSDLAAMIPSCVAAEMDYRREHPETKVSEPSDDDRELYVLYCEKVGTAALSYEDWKIHVKPLMSM